MFTIRKDHMIAFSRAASQSFEDRMLKHLRQFFPDQCTALGESTTREHINYGIHRAAIYGIVVERDVCKFIDIMFTFGRDFDDGVNFPWARRILLERQFPSPSARVCHLYEVAMSEVLKAANGASARQ